MKDKQPTGRHQATGRHTAPLRAAAPPPPPPPPKKRRGLSRRGVGVLAALLAFALIVTAATLVRNAAEERRYEAYLGQARAGYDSGDYDGALSALRRAAAERESDEVLLLMADCYEAQGSLEKALELVRRLDLKDPAVQRRIAALEEKRAQRSRADKVEINGREYDRGTPALALRDLGGGDELLRQVAQLYALTNLSLPGNGLTDITPLAGLGGLTALDLSRNQISDLSALSSLKGLRSLYLDENPIGDFSPLYGLSELSTLSIRGIEISQEALTALAAALPGCAIHSNAPAASVREITLGGLTFPADVEELDLSGRGLSDISALSGCRGLKRLDLTGNQISDLTPLMDLPGLEWLSIKDNLVADLRPLISLTGLSTLYAEGNAIASTVPLGALVALRELHLAGNPITDFSGLARLAQLETLGLEETGLRDEDLPHLSGLSRLRLLTLYDNPALSGEGVDGLKYSLSTCYIQTSPLVYSVEIAGQRIRRDVTELDLSDTAVGDLSPLSLLSGLERLKLRGCSLQSITDLQSLTGLKELDLACNQIQNAVPLAALYRLEVLDVSSNQLTGVGAFSGLSSLRELNLSGNNIPPEEIARLRLLLPECHIIFE